MKKKLLIAICILIVHNIYSQNIRNYNLEVSCKSRIHNSSLSILDFKWKNPPPTAVGQRVFRKTKDAYAWGSIYRNLNNNDTTFSDTIATGSHFEYRFEKDTGHDGYSVQGYIYAGHRVLPITQRGIILLVIDSTHKVFLANDFRTFRNDLIGDGWFTKILWVSPTTTVSTIKTYIVNEYNANPSQVKSVCLIGDVAVPYSGNYSAFGIMPPDGHTTFGPPSHEGAWPADMYYGDMDNASWTDISVTNNSGARVENRNNPGDGKFDQTSIPTLIELQVGRIDLSSLGSFSESEQLLLRRYFLKNHQYKHQEFNIVERCLIDDNFGLLNYPYPNIDEHFAGNAYRNMAPLISDSVCFNLNYLSTLNANSYQWSFGFGAGSYTNASGVATTAQLANPAQEVRSVFTGLFGSYFGDWDNSNNFLRAPLASRGHVLNSFWVGRPHWFFHHMGLGENIGYSSLRTQNNYNTSTFNLLYPTTSFAYLQVHVALMGDPTTRTQVVEPISDLVTIQDTCNERFKLTWSAPSDTAVHQYYVFRAKHIDSVFTQIATVNVSNFTDSFPLTGINVYMVRAIKLQVSGSGTYFNLSQGVFDTIAYTIPTAIAGIDTSICLNSILTLGTTTHGNSVNTIYEWQSGGFSTDTITFAATINESKILIVIDTLTNCVLRDTIDITILQLPLPETITASGSICNDTITWSCSANNIAAHTYNWQFLGGQPDDTSGNMLINPGKVVYPSIGTYDMILTITNNTNSCQLLDTNTQVISCLGLSIQTNRLLNCKTNTIIIKMNEELMNKYSEIIFKGFRKNKWERLSSFNILESENYYFQQKSQLYSKYGVYGVNKNNSKEDLIGNCGDNFYSSEFNISPIPFIDYINIFTEDPNLFNEFCNIELINLHGKIVKKLDDILLNDNTRLNLVDLSNGVYFIKISVNNQTFVYKIIK